MRLKTSQFICEIQLSFTFPETKTKTGTLIPISNSIYLIILHQFILIFYYKSRVLCFNID
jgi:hypothetical protein